MTTEEAIRCLRRDPRHAELVRDAYLGEDVAEAVERFRISAEFATVWQMTEGRVRGGTVLDLGAGIGMAAYAFATCGAARVYALEPDPGEIGRKAIEHVAAGKPIEVMNGFGEAIPLPDETVDLVYARQVLHHTSDLPQVLRECVRVLRRGGQFLACREPVAENARQLADFLGRHPVHRLAGGENAFPLKAYLEAIRSAGLQLDRLLGPWDSPINAFPAVRSAAELQQMPRCSLERRLGRPGLWLSHLPGATALVWAWLNRPRPGRMYSFLATKP